MAHHKKGNVAILLVAILTVVLFAGGFMVLRASQNVMKKAANFQNTAAGRPVTTVASQSNDYENPFTTTAQTANPFDEYQNPFDEIQ